MLSRCTSLDVVAADGGGRRGSGGPGPLVGVNHEVGSGWHGTSQHLASLFIEVLGGGSEAPESREEGHYCGDDWESDENHDRNAGGEEPETVASPPLTPSFFYKETEKSR